jgi:ubiquinone biosynthesis protein Coq4
LYNPKQRRWAIARHDLHHVATGFGTDLVGEMEISGWEVGAGLGRLWVAWAICWPVFLVGLVRSRTRTLAAYRLGRRCRSLFARPDAYDEWLQWSVGDLRRELGIDA